MTELSVIIPVLDRAGQLEKVLQGLAQQSLSRDRFEAVVVDDGSMEDVSSAVQRYEALFNVRCLSLGSNQGRASARNHGIKAAVGGIILFLDADSLPEQSLLQRHLEFHAGNANACLLGRRFELHPADESAALDPRGQKALQEDLLSRDLRDDILGNPEFSGTWGSVGWAFAYTHNLSYPKAVLAAIGGFDEALKGWGGEDQDLSLRASMKVPGLRFAYDPQACCFHLPHLRDRGRETREMFSNLDDIFARTPVFQFELFYALSFTNFLRRLPYYQRLQAAAQGPALKALVARSGQGVKVGADECVLWMGDRGGDGEHHYSFDLALPTGPRNAHCLGLKIPFKGVHFDRVIAVDLWRALLWPDLSAFIDQALGRCKRLELLWTPQLAQVAEGQGLRLLHDLDATVYELRKACGQVSVQEVAGAHRITLQK